MVQSWLASDRFIETVEATAPILSLCIHHLVLIFGGSLRSADRKFCECRRIPVKNVVGGGLHPCKNAKAWTNAELKGLRQTATCRRRTDEIDPLGRFTPTRYRLRRDPRNRA